MGSGSTGTRARARSPKHGGRYRMDEFEADTTYDLLYTGR